MANQSQNDDRSTREEHEAELRGAERESVVTVLAKVVWIGATLALMWLAYTYLPPDRRWPILIVFIGYVSWYLYRIR